jgi:hypothetical protein
MPDIYRAIRLHTAVSGCRNSMRLRFSTQSVSVLRSQCTEGRQPGVTWGNRDRHFHRALIDFEICASAQHLLRLRHLGGGNEFQAFCCRRIQPADTAATAEEGRRTARPLYATAAVRAPFYQHYSHWPSSVHARDQPSQPGC